MSYPYNPPFILRNGHLQSIYPSVFRKVNAPPGEKEQIDTPDGDFLNLEWVRKGNDKLVILSHGLEGHSQRPYMRGMAKAASLRRYDVLSWNFRSCGGQQNKLFETYHSGQIRDLALVVQHAISCGYSDISLIGFSIGGNKTLRFLAMGDDSLVNKISAACVFSVPVDLESCAYKLAEPRNKIYMKNFLVSFEEKLKHKKKLYPDKVDMEAFAKVRNFIDYDELFTAPINGFASAVEYWRESSSKPHIPSIMTPTLIVTALDDPFLTPEAYPHKEAAENAMVTLETPKYGGHVGFMSGFRKQEYWSETRAFRYFEILREKS